MKSLLISLISVYQKYLSFDRGVLTIFAPSGACRYEVSCSQYTKQAILDYGAVRGLWAGFKRIWRCR